MPDFVDDNADTQVDDQQYDDQYQDDQSQDTADGGQGEDEDFLVVNDRTRYKTREEALKGFQNASHTIASLSPWGKLAKELGVTPEQAAAIIREHSAKKPNQNGQQANSGNAQDGNAQATHSIDESQLTAEEKQALQWLKKVAPALGFVPASELKDLKQQIEELRGFKSQSEEHNFETLVETGRSELGSLLKEAKLKDDAQTKRFVEAAVKDWIDEDDARVARFYKGGQATRELIKEAFDAVVGPVFGVQRIQQKADATRTKTSVQNRNARPNPAQQQQRRPQVPNGQRQQQRSGPGQPKVDPMKSVHDQAWAAFQRATGRANESDE